jgi:hypothetical protein
METRQQRLIREALEGRDAASTDSANADLRWRAPQDTSLRKKSLRRAAEDYVPRTLTAHEWEDYYREHGVPSEHRQGRAPGDKPTAKVGELTGHRRG